MFPRGKWYAVDLRRWDAGRPTMRNPSHPGWPEEGERTQFADVAKEWAWDYLRHFQQKRHRRQTGRPPPAPRLDDAVERWLRHREQTASPNTVLLSRTVANHLLDAFGGSRPVTYVTTERLQDWFSRRLEEGYRASTMDNYRNYMAAFFQWLGRGEVTQGIELPTRGEFDPVAWTDAQLSDLRDAADDLGPDYRLQVEAAVGTGARRNELAALRWSDFSPERHVVRIERQVKRTGRNVRPLKGKRARTALVLPDWWEWHDPAGTYMLGGERPQFKDTVQRRFREIIEAAELHRVGIGAHSFRHTYARLFLEGGGSLEQLQRFLGHASITTTQQTYGHFGDEAAVRLAREQFYE